MARRCILVIRIRGGVNASVRVEDTLRMLRVDRNNTATIVDDRPEYMGMLQRAKDRITWGEPASETIRLLLEKRGEAVGGGPIGAETLKALNFDGIIDLSEALVKCDVELSKLEGIKPFFRLHPPKGGFKRTVKRAHSEGGELGNRGEAINEIVKRMC